ncbi:cell wall-associated NlpC family hydrolase [Blastococcus colisei]|uniref:Cell wall-associated NlpC family hydrolase n=1 Tax=Blastococcus colisei TaxID=1564162 RepID=A0A543PA18_9ACTN|nr:C40 family peptidase [Blastococcus colisei]TQN40931.1 cell wall-associated NlpC family hydrolase [Blastococcus colisei]
MQSTRTTTRRRSRAVLALGAVLVAASTGVLAPSPAAADPTTSAQVQALMRETAQQLTVIDEQLHEAELIVAAQQQAADAAAAQAAAAQQALDVFAPQIRAIAQSGFTGKTQSRVAAFLTSASAEELVQQMTTLDMIAAHTNDVVTEASLAQKAAQDAQTAADQAAAAARAGLEQLQAQKAEAEQKAAAYQADFARLSAAEQAALTTAVAGRSLQAPRNLPLPPGAAGAAIETALAQVGDRYVSGASGPDAFDCSGLTSYAYAAAGITLPRSSRAQSQIGTQVSRAELQPGDLVFYYTPISHVALYIGDGMIVHARTHGVPLSVTSVDQRGFRFGVRLG